MRKSIVLVLLFAFLNLPLSQTYASTKIYAGRKIPVTYTGEKVSGKDLTSVDKITAQIQNDILSPIRNNFTKKIKINQITIKIKKKVLTQISTNYEIMGIR